VQVGSFRSVMEIPNSCTVKTRRAQRNEVVTIYTTCNPQNSIHEQPVIRNHPVTLAGSLRKSIFGSFPITIAIACRSSMRCLPWQNGKQGITRNPCYLSTRHSLSYPCFQCSSSNHFTRGGVSFGPAPRRICHAAKRLTIGISSA
jgi:hypothetical protein